MMRIPLILISAYTLCRISTGITLYAQTKLLSTDGLTYIKPSPYTYALGIITSGAFNAAMHRTNENVRWNRFYKQNLNKQYKFKTTVMLK